MSAVICAIALNEEPYLDEWIEYHLALGFEHVYLYDNALEPTDFSRNMFDRSRVSITHWPGRGQQYPAFRHFLNSEVGHHKWVSFHDCDEFIVLKKHKNIVDFLKEYCENGAISLNWYLYGTNWHIKKNNEPVVKRFTKREKVINDHVKSICVIADIETIYNAHFPILKKGYQKDTNSKVINGPFNKNGPSDVAVVNHYWCKSVEEYEIRFKGYGGDGNPKTTLISNMEYTNEVYDPSAYVFYTRSTLKPNL